MVRELGLPKWFYAISGRMLPWLSIAAILLIAVGVVWGLAFAPQDYQQGNRGLAASSCALCR